MAEIILNIDSPDKRRRFDLTRCRITKLTGI